METGIPYNPIRLANATLPQEIFDRIKEYVYSLDAAGEVSNQNGRTLRILRPPLSKRSLMPISFDTCRSMRAPAVEAFYSQSTFFFASSRQLLEWLAMLDDPRPKPDDTLPAILENRRPKALLEDVRYATTTEPEEEAAGLYDEDVGNDPWIRVGEHLGEGFQECNSVGSIST